MSKYKVGDRVLLKSNLQIDTEYGDDYIMPEMLKTPIVTIKEIIQAGGDEFYQVEENVYSYNDNMFLGEVNDFTADLIFTARKKLAGKSNANEPATDDPISHPSHYTDGKIEVIDFIEDKKLGFHLGNVVKYVARAGKKNPDKYYEDLKKAAWYLNREIEKGEKND